MGIAGGANAIKGFNYQKAVINLISVLNYNKTDFIAIFVENQDDIEVIMQDSHTFLQAKSKRLNITDLIKPDTENYSILGKNLQKNKKGTTSRYKIICTDFSKKDKDDLQATTTENHIFDDEIYKYSDAQKQKIINCLEKQGLSIRVK
jgi:hypothetical protein